MQFLRPALAGEERLAPYRGVLARLLPGWSAGPPASAPLTDPIVPFGEAVIELLEFSSGGHGLVLLLDDLHWAHRDTMALLGYLAGRAGRTGILGVGGPRRRAGLRTWCRRWCGTPPSPTATTPAWRTGVVAAGEWRGFTADQRRKTSIRAGPRRRSRGC